MINTNDCSLAWVQYALTHVIYHGLLFRASEHRKAGASEHTCQRKTVQSQRAQSSKQAGAQHSYISSPPVRSEHTARCRNDTDPRCLPSQVPGQPNAAQPSTLMICNVIPHAVRLPQPPVPCLTPARQRHIKTEPLPPPPLPSSSPLYPCQPICADPPLRSGVGALASIRTFPDEFPSTPGGKLREVLTLPSPVPISWARALLVTAGPIAPAPALPLLLPPPTAPVPVPAPVPAPWEGACRPRPPGEDWPGTCAPIPSGAPVFSSACCGCNGAGFAGTGGRGGWGGSGGRIGGRMSDGSSGWIRCGGGGM